MTIINPRILRYLSTGLLNTLFGYTVYSFLVFFRLDIQLALLISTVCGVAFNYISFSKIVFFKKLSFSRVTKYLICYALIYAINLFSLQIFIENFGVGPYLSQAISLLLVVPISWVLLNYFAFS